MDVDHADDDFELAATRWRGRVGDRDVADVVAIRQVAEDRDRFTYFDQLRSADDSAWDAAVSRFREQWAEHQERWPASARDVVDRSSDPPGSWRGDSGRYLNAADSEEVDARCERIAEAERTTISPAMRAIEAADPTRELAGWDHRLKGSDRIKDKVADLLNSRPGLSCGEALAGVPDAARFTFLYHERKYVSGAWTDIERMRVAGFELVRVRNTWSSEHYRGINTQWRDGDGQRFEVQFHTHASLEAKELTHVAYEKARNPMTSDAERDALLGYQRDLYRTVRPPDGADRINDYPSRTADG